MICNVSLEPRPGNDDKVPIMRRILHENSTLQWIFYSMDILPEVMNDGVRTSYIYTYITL